MKLAGHPDFKTTHKFCLAVADDLKDRARWANAPGLCRKLVQIGALSDISKSGKEQAAVTTCRKKSCEVGRGGIEPPTHGFSVRCSTD